jgi:hypothetical protein
MKSATFLSIFAVTATILTLIANEASAGMDQSTGTVGFNGSNGIECNLTKKTEYFSRSEFSSAPIVTSYTMLFEFLPENKFKVVVAGGQDVIGPMTITDTTYAIDGPRDWNNTEYHGHYSGLIVNRLTGEVNATVTNSESSETFVETTTGTCHAAHVGAKM